MCKLNSRIARSNRRSCWHWLGLAIVLAASDFVAAQDLKLKIDLTPPVRERPVRRMMPRLELGGSAQPAPTTLKKRIALPEQLEASEKELNQLGVDLAAAEFRVRKAASDRLKTLTTAGIGKLAARLLNSPSAEAIIRVHSELEWRYQSQSLNDRTQASRLLEKMAEQARLLSADPAQHSLQKHWKTRIEVAFEELKAMGAIVKNGNFSMPNGVGGRGDPRPARQILLTKTWKGGDKGLDVFRRLDALFGPIQSYKGINVYLLNGHPLTLDQEKKLTNIVGANRIIYRSSVALGITADRMTQGLFDGILIRGVSKGGSAEKAGLGEGDFLLAMYGPGEKVQPIPYDPESWRTFRRRAIPQPGGLRPPQGDDEDLPENPNRLVDFDQLVERLKKFQPGDKVRLQVVKEFRAVQMFRPFPVLPRDEVPKKDGDDTDDSEKVIEVAVELIGWAELPMVE